MTNSADPISHRNPILPHFHLSKKLGVGEGILELGEACVFEDQINIFGETLAFEDQVHYPSESGFLNLQALRYFF